MQVRKFEARTMKEALEMVKVQLGPDAIILSAKDNSKGFGLVGQGSVEITAAVSEETYKKKQFAESRLRAQDKERLLKSPAKVQKSFIEKSVNKYHADNKPRPQITSTRYIDIDSSEDFIAAEIERENADLRIKSAAQRAWNAMQSQGGGLEMFMPQSAAAPQRSAAATTSPQRTSAPQTITAETDELKALRQELAGLKQVIAQFQKIPQNMVNPHPGASYGLAYELSQTFERLTSAGIAEDIAADMLIEAQKQMPAIRFKNKALVEGWVARHILEQTKIVENTVGTQVQIFAGPAGSGKTSTLVKLASHYVVKDKKKVALITADTMKVGASDQLRIYAQILNVPFAIIRSSQDWRHILSQLKNYDYILCDFPGLSLKTIEEIQIMKNLIPDESVRATTHLVLSATDKDQELAEVGKRYKALHYKDVIFTGLDEAIQHGSIYSFMKRFNVPLHSFGIGPRVPEDYEAATKERVLDLIFKLSKMKAKEAI